MSLLFQVNYHFLNSSSFPRRITISERFDVRSTRYFIIYVFLFVSCCSSETSILRVPSSHRTPIKFLWIFYCKFHSPLDRRYAFLLYFSLNSLSLFGNSTENRKALNNAVTPMRWPQFTNIIYHTYPRIQFFSTHL